MFSRLGGNMATGRSFYEELRAREDDPDGDDTLRLDEENLRHHFSDDEAAIGLDAGDSRITVASGHIGGHARPLGGHALRSEGGVSKWPHPDDDFDNDVPTSLLIEPNDPSNKQRQDTHHPSHAGTSGAGPSTRHNQEMWNAAAAQQPLHPDNLPSGPIRDRPRSVLNSVKINNARDKAMWRWVNVTNLDSFVRDVYHYYEGGGLWVIQSSNALQLL